MENMCDLLFTEIINEKCHEKLSDLRSDLRKFVIIDGIDIWDNMVIRALNTLNRYKYIGHSERDNQTEEKERKNVEEILQKV